MFKEFDHYCIYNCITVTFQFSIWLTVTSPSQEGGKVINFNDKSKPHNLKVVGSNPTPATRINPAIAGFVVADK